MVIKIIKKNNKIIEEPITPKVKKKLVPTLRQAKVIALVGKGGESKASIIRKAGYGKTMPNHPEKVFDSPVVAEAVKETVNKMKRIRDKMLNALEQKPMDKQSPYNLTVMQSILTKDSELLDGKPTSREIYQLPEEEKKHLDELFKMNS